VARGNVPTTGPLAASSAGQLACFTVEGLIRAHVRGMHKGMCHPPSVVWYAYKRWAASRGELATKADDAWWRRSGWLVDVPMLAERRGPAPATVAALRAGRQGSVERPAGSSQGAHALIRTLPAGLCDWWSGQYGLAAEIAASTHAGTAVTAAAAGACLITLLCRGQPLDDAVATVQAGLPRSGTAMLRADLTTVICTARAQAGNETTLRQLASAGDASSALTGGLYAVAHAHRPEQAPEALMFAACAGDGGHAAAVAGAILGAIHGPECIPTNWLARLELVWVGDTLARDLARQIAESPSGTEFAPANDDSWWNRYPGS
jgi:ADP-ribosylglycohydrolase